MTAPTEQRSNADLLNELRALVDSRPRWRLHVHPESVVWIMVGVQNAELSEHVQVVADPACLDAGKGWVEALTAGQWRGLRALVGHQVTVTTANLGTMAGTLLALDQGEARLDLGDGDIRYLAWLTVDPAPKSPTT